MLTFSGKKHKAGNSVRFQTEIKTNQDFWGAESADRRYYLGHFCNAAAEVTLLEVEDQGIYDYFCHYPDHRSICGWGYDGHSADLCSINLLNLSVLQGERDNDNDHYAVYACLRGRLTPEEKSITLLYYRDFTKEHTSKWGDEWTMTSDEVMAWLVSKGYKQKEKVVR